MADPSSAESVYNQAFKRMLSQQRERAREQILLEQHMLSRVQEETVKEEVQRRQKLSVHVRYQQELAEQIKKDHIRKEQIELEKQLPGIADELHGYPHRPQTPRDVRRKRELEKQFEFSRSVTEQQAERLRLKKVAREQEQKLVTEIIDMDKRERDREIKAELLRKKKVRDELRKAWLEADQARQFLLEIEKTVSEELKSTKTHTVPVGEKRQEHISEKSEESDPIAQVTEEVQTSQPEPAQEQTTPSDPKPKDEPQMTLSQIRSLAQFLADSTPKLPVIRQYRANDQSFTSPNKRRARQVPTT